MTDEILFEKRGKAGVVTLNRPKALNALSHGMVRALAQKLDEWKADADVRHVLVTAAGEKAFCAGGDILQLYHMGKAGKAGTPEQLAFFADEYRLNYAIKTYPKPYVALVDGIVMGGGVGISVHGSHRIAGERVTFAMPEVGIGFFPDVGGTYFLPRMPHETGMYAALTAARLKQADCLWTGIATHAAPSESLSEILDALTRETDVDGVLRESSADAGPAPLAERAGFIEKVFGRDSVAEILAALDEAEGADREFAQKTAATIRSKSPSSLAITYRQLREGAGLGFADAMRLDFRIVSRIMKGHDFYEGVRSVLVDKDNRPHWNPSSLDTLDSRDVAAHFEAPTSGDLDLSA
ncbi:enoyl-CoA hydratase/isomerase family protein [Stappia sp. F7233]|uniref:3-hydroxyisobutyryl-CoA hydrolase n=1 Tax=Stappia albiluteola TaxID=2758565 RepID=A0A839ACJ0_9HYPH|nr:enoyl-CoA hydratase/isomerase family protein [Stappia albiluteola]MBA5776652.1 enoyl-CoA hydratase/isomerase family protein [Stappia albiluteola]